MTVITSFLIVNRTGVFVFVLYKRAAKAMGKATDFCPSVQLRNPVTNFPHTCNFKLSPRDLPTCKI